MRWYFKIKTKNERWSMAFWPVMLLGKYADEYTVPHEEIHFKQQLELLIIPHAILYGIFHLLYGYKRNPFEREAYTMQFRPHCRRWFGWVKYL